jgi:hypothetical protein
MLSFFYKKSISLFLTSFKYLKWDMYWMSQKGKKIVIMGIVILIILVSIMAFYPYPFFGPFEYPPETIGDNCDKEYRFKFETSINSVDSFIQFLKEHQYNGSLVGGYSPSTNQLIPSHAAFVIGHNGSSNPPNRSSIPPINLDTLKANVIVENSKAIFSNERIYTLKITNEIFNDDWPWMLLVKISETGYVSVRFCAGI